MRKKLTAAAAAFAWLLTSAGAQASPGWTSAGPITDVKAREMGVDITVPTAGNPMTCATQSVFRIRADAQNYQTLVALLMTQYAAQKAVVFWVSACETDGTSSVVAVDVN